MYDLDRLRMAAVVLFGRRNALQHERRARAGKFSDGVTEGIIAELGTFRDLLVIARRCRSLWARARRPVRPWQS
jgi:TolB-like protein